MRVSTSLERRIDYAMHELVQIRTELQMKKMQELRSSSKVITAWNRLSMQISSKWDAVSVHEEIEMQREKTW